MQLRRIGADLVVVRYSGGLRKPSSSGTESFDPLALSVRSTVVVSIEWPKPVDGVGELGVMAGSMSVVDWVTRGTA